MPETTQFGGFQDDSPSDSALQVNTILLARYKIEGQLGGGGQGAVYQARDLNFPDSRRLVAIKEMHVITNDNKLRASTMKTFQRERRRNHPYQNDYFLTCSQLQGCICSPIYRRDCSVHLHQEL